MNPAPPPGHTYFGTPEEQFDAHIQEKLSFIKSTRDLSQHALRAPSIINAASAGLVIGFLANSEAPRSDLIPVAETIIYFIIGVLIAGLSLGFAYWGSLLGWLGRKKLEEDGYIFVHQRRFLGSSRFLNLELFFSLVAVACSTSSYISFILGALQLNSAILRLFMAPQ